MSILLIILCIVGFLFLFTATMSSILYWYETINTPCPDIPSPKPGPVAFIQLFMLSLAGYITGVCLYPVGLFWKRQPSPLTPQTEAGKPPVILTHGINDNAGALLFLCRRLEKQGYRVFIFSYRSLFTSLDAIIARFDDFVHMVEASFPGQKPVLIGHSLGGLLMRHWLSHEPNSVRPCGLITLGTPHGGSKMAVFAPGRLAKQLLPASSFIAELGQEKRAEGVPCIALASPIDEAVLPAASLVPPQGWKLRVTNRSSHFSMLFCAWVFRALLEELSSLGTTKDAAVLVAPEGD